MHTSPILIAALALTSAAHAQPAPDYDFQWATIGNVNNPAYAGDPEFGTNAGRGSVPYTFRASKLEITTSQWMEFLNTFSSQGKDMSYFKPLWWGAQFGGSTYSLRPVASASLIPVRGITWRAAAQYCNWLHNDKSANSQAMLSGAYDVSTFSTLPDGSFTDQREHSPGAKFWIPTLDEWMKAAHYDPDRYGQGQGGWWEFQNGTNSPSVSGPPGVGETSAGWRTSNFAEWDVPLGAYPQTLSPYGLLDLSGGASEWLEYSGTGNRRTSRGLEGGWAGSGQEFIEYDRAGITTALDPEYSGHAGLRIVSVPAPGAMLVLAWGLRTLIGRRR